jgi:hypothetical protein
MLLSVEDHMPSVKPFLRIHIICGGMTVVVVSCEQFCLASLSI